MAYKYRLKTQTTALNYNISPDFGTIIYPGDTVTITGTIKNTQDTIRGFGIEAWARNAYLWLAEPYDLTVPVNKVGSFSITKQLNDDISINTFQQLAEQYNEIHIQFYLFKEAPYIAPFLDTLDTAFAENPAEQNLIFAKHRISPQILNLDFERATETGEWADDGLYLRCKALKIAINSEASTDDITIAKLTCTGSDGSSHIVELTKGQIEQALSVDGYHEDKATLFSFESALGVSYTIIFTLGDEKQSVTSTDTVLRSFARIHFAGASTGGVAIGMFSSATEGHPKFEVADNHESHFYGPSTFHKGITGGFVYTAESQGDGSYNTEALTGGTWVDGKPIWRRIYKGKRTFDTAQNNIIAIGLDGAIDSLVSIQGYVKDNTGLIYPIPCAAPSLNYTLTFRAKGQTVSLYYLPNGGWAGTVDFTVIVEYTRV